MDKLIKVNQINGFFPIKILVPLESALEKKHGRGRGVGKDVHLINWTLGSGILTFRAVAFPGSPQDKECTVCILTNKILFRVNIRAPAVFQMREGLYRHIPPNFIFLVSHGEGCGNV